MPVTPLHFSRRTLMTGLAGGVLAAAAPGAASRAQSESSGNVLKISTIGLDTSDFHRHTGSIGVVQVMAETLTAIGADGSTTPFLAEKWDISEDGRSYRFAIRQGVKFHNGRVMTSHDVAANVERIRSEIKGGWLTSTFKTVESLETPDDHTMVMRLTQPFAPLLNLLAEMWIVAPESPGWDSNITQPICTGPFVFANWEPQVKLLAPAFKDYWMPGRPKVDAVLFDLTGVADASLGLRAGDYHIAIIQTNKVNTVAHDPRTSVVYQYDTNWNFWSFNNRRPKPPFDNIKVRQAIGHAMNKAALAHIGGGAGAVVTNQMVAPGNFYFSEELNKADAYAKPDLALSHQLLAEAKVDPSKVTVRVVTAQGDLVSAPSIEMLRQLGFQIDDHEYDDLGFQQALSGYEWDFFPSGSGPRTDIYLRYVRLMSDGPNSGLWGGIQDPALDRMIEEAVTSMDGATRKAHYVEAMRYILDRCYFFPIFHARNAYGVRKEVHGFTPGFTYALHGPDFGISGVTIGA
jgi:peptide/nickel transport system substrate-binding protein